MKICFIGEYSFQQWCGSATTKVQRYIFKELSKNNYVIFYELPYSQLRFRKLLSKLYRIPGVDGKIISGGLFNFILYLLSGRFNIIHIIVIRKYMLLLLPALLILSSKVVVTLHDTIFLRKPEKNADYYLKRILIAICKEVFVFNYSDLNLLLLYKSSSKIKVVKNGVDLSIYKAADINFKKKIVTFAGGLGSDFKGLTFLEFALKILEDDIRLQICGENPDHLTHPFYIGELNEQQFVQQLWKSSLVVIPSRYESFSLTTLEAMAAGVPVIITNGTGISVYLKDKYNSIIIQYGDVNALVQSLYLLLNNKKVYNRIRTNALLTVRSFSWKIAAHDYEEIYKTS